MEKADFCYNNKHNTYCYLSVISIKHFFSIIVDIKRIIVEIRVVSMQQYHGLH